MLQTPYQQGEGTLPANRAPARQTRHAVHVDLALAHHAAQPFNGLYFATAAAVIPVFFLALIIPGGTFYRALTASAARARRRRDRRLAGPVTAVRDWRDYLATQALLWGPTGILIYGTMGEIWALASLWAQRPEGEWALTLFAAIFLAAGAAAGPFMSMQATMREQALLEEEGDAAAKAFKAARNARPADAETPSATPGKTDKLSPGENS